MQATASIQLEFDFSASASGPGYLTALDLCLDLLRPYVERGDSLNEINRANYGWYCFEFEVHCKGGFITVTRFNGHPDRWFRVPIRVVVEAITAQS